jgi:hypothetical protein
MVHPASKSTTIIHQVILGNCAAWSAQMVGSSSPGVECVLPAARRSTSLQQQANQLAEPLSV